MTFDTIFAGSLSIDTITLAAFTAANGVRLLAYMPQIWKAAKDDNGASGISFTTWSLFLSANISTVAYALVNRGDRESALCFAVNAVCCLAILAVAFWKRRGHMRRLRSGNRFAPLAIR